MCIQHFSGSLFHEIKAASERTPGAHGESAYVTVVHFQSFLAVVKTHESRIVDRVHGRFLLLDGLHHQRADEAMNGAKDVVQMNDIGRFLFQKLDNAWLRTRTAS